MKIQVGWILAGILCFTAGGDTLAGEATDLIKVNMFNLRDVRLLGGPLYKQQEQNRLYLHKLDPDRLLSWFRKEAGLEPKAPPYRGWESEGQPLAGHILGFYMSGVSMMVQATGDEVLRQRLGYIVDQLDDVQQANQSGYMLAVPNGKSLFADIAKDNFKVDGGSRNGYIINGYFEPIYTINKLMLGLYQIYLATGNEKAKQVFLRLADWFGHDIIDLFSDEQVQKLLHCEHGSLHESYLDAYTLSGNSKYLKWARRLCHERMLAPLAENNVDFITHFHANCNIPKYTGFQHIYRVTGEERLHTAAMNFWNDVVTRRSWVIGANSAHELFFDPGEFTNALNVLDGPESCNSVNMLRLTEALFQTHPSSRMMDFYERVLFNHILSSHDNERGMFAYYTPMFPGAYRVYSDEFDSMWCCVGTGLEVPGKYAQMVYTCSPDNTILDVNLFAASELDWSARGVTVRQDTDFPYQPATALTLKCSRPDMEFTLRVRHPAWVPDGHLKLSLNGKTIANESKSGSYASIQRQWQTGDVVGVELPMHLTLEPLPGNDDYVAFLYGPIVLSGQLGRTGGLTKDDFWQIATTVGTKTIPRTGIPRIVVGPKEDLISHIKPIDGKPLQFRTNEMVRPEDMTLIPFFENHFQRYAVYWQRQTPEIFEREQELLKAKAKEKAALDARTLDSVMIGDEQSEKTHKLDGHNTHTGFGAYSQEMDARWRDASDGGWFSYVMTVNDKSPLILRCDFWGREWGARTFDILADGQILSTQSLTDTGKDGFVHLDLKLPDSLVKDKSSVTIKFQAHPANTAGGIFDVRILRAE
ncbi:MAG: beta-L-arabinofuranosidase domain-containing protein [Anaerohalosphaeraceae bacterium]